MAGERPEPDPAHVRRRSRLSPAAKQGLRLHGQAVPDDTAVVGEGETRVAEAVA